MQRLAKSSTSRGRAGSIPAPSAENMKDGAEMVEQGYTADSSSAGREAMGVRLPLSALIEGERMRRRLSKSKKHLVFMRDGRRCLACGATRDLTCDHIVPLARGGTNAMDNLQTLCDRCNVLKGFATTSYRTEDAERACAGCGEARFFDAFMWIDRNGGEKASRFCETCRASQ